MKWIQQAPSQLLLRVTSPPLQTLTIAASSTGAILVTTEENSSPRKDHSLPLIHSSIALENEKSGAS